MTRRGASQVGLGHLSDDRDLTMKNRIVNQELIGIHEKKTTIATVTKGEASHRSYGQSIQHRFVLGNAKWRCGVLILQPRKRSGA
jgi:hypothetical protein